MKKRFSFETSGKLVRDKVLIALSISDPLARVSSRYLSKEELKKYLLEKLVEEAKEVAEAKDLTELKVELADVQQVVGAIQKQNNITQDNLCLVAQGLSKEAGRECLITQLVEKSVAASEAKNITGLKVELAAVQQVIESIKKQKNVTQNDLDLILQPKIERLGTFDNGLFIEWVELEPCYLYDYFLSQPNKYPELPIKTDTLNS